MIQKTEESLRQLPKPPSKDALTEILHLLADFSKDLSVCLEGTPGEDGLLQAIRPYQLVFKKAIRSTAPDFKAKGSSRKNTLTAAKIFQPEQGENFSFLATEEDEDTVTLANKTPIYIDEVMARANQ